MLSRLIGAAMLVLLAGCQTNPHKGEAFTEAAPPDGGHALVYLFRIGSTPLYVDAPMHVNGEVRVAMPNRGYQPLYLAPGSYTIGTRWPVLSGQYDVEQRFNFQAGQTYYVALTKPDVESIQVLLDPKKHLLAQYEKSDAMPGLSQCTPVTGSKP